MYGATSIDELEMVAIEIEGHENLISVVLANMNSYY
ncbi:hypothetical protein Lepto7376_2374 [[Leptolyngbya] sp. PCC 7376]|nr:hypothetical protein Lepto7376_2374 [[Leptolyngbya] sp. PCC 7376]